MKKISLAIATAILFSCNSGSDEKITGTYVRESKWEQKNVNTGKVLGNTESRDTIFITKKSEGYQVDNNIWWKNDYDQKGWQNKSDISIKTHTVNYDKTDNSLNTEMNLYKPMYLDFENGLLYYSKNSKPWRKIKP